MFCNECGQKLPAGSRFCNYCGAATAASARSRGDDFEDTGVTVRPAPARVARETSRRPARPDPPDAAGEEAIFTLRPTLIFVFVRYAVAALFWLAIAAALGVMKSMHVQWMTGPLVFVVLLVTGLVIFANPVYKHILRRREVYTLTNHKLEMRYGLLAKIVRNIPLRNIQDVTVTASAWQRLINIGDIVIESASDAGRIVLDDIHYPDRYAGMIMGELRRN